MFLQDLNRQVVKSDAASFTIPELEFESPAFSQKGGKGLPLPFFFFVAGGGAVSFHLNKYKQFIINLSATQFAFLTVYTISLHCFVFV